MVFESFLEEVVKPCASCQRIVAMLRVSSRCDVCEQAEAEKRKPEEQAAKLADDRARWKRQGIPSRFWGFELEQKHLGLLKKSCMIFGDVGTGKSCLGAQVMKRTGGKFISAISMLDEVQDNNAKMWDFKDKSSICIDDIQKLNPTDYRLEKFFEIFDARYANDKHTIVTCDTLASEIKDKWGKQGEAIVSRIAEWMTKVHMGVKYR